MEEENKDLNTTGGAPTPDAPSTTGDVLKTDPITGEPETPTVETTEPETPVEEKKDIVTEVGSQLSEEAEGKGEGEGVANPQDTKPFDITNLTLEQRQSLKEQLNTTPSREIKKVKNPTVRIREIDGNIVVDMKNAYVGLVDDPEHNRKLERHLIPIKFYGSKEFTNVLFSTFINSPQIKCEVIGKEEEVKEIGEGEVWSREKKTIVEMIRKEVVTTFEVKLPNGEVVKIESKMANA